MQLLIYNFLFGVIFGVSDMKIKIYKVISFVCSTVKPAVVSILINIFYAKVYLLLTCHYLLPDTAHRAAQAELRLRLDLRGIGGYYKVYCYLFYC